MRGVITASLLLVVVSLPPLAADLYLVRHAEKRTDDSADPPLTPAGTERAESLADLLRSAGIGRVFSTDFSRTRETAAPTARSANVRVEIYDPTAPESFAARLLELDENALIVGHSNTTPELVELLGGDPGPPIAEAWEYDRLYVLVVEGRTVVRTILLRSPPATSGAP